MDTNTLRKLILLIRRIISKQLIHAAIILLILMKPGYPQSGKTLKGIVLTLEKQPVENAEILLKELNKHTITNRGGVFQIQNLTGEKATLVIECLGYETSNKIVSLNNEFEVIEVEILLNDTTYNFDEVVITGTRSEKKLKDTPVRTEVISSSELKQSGFSRLTDVLIEQTGLAITDNHGSGIQIQGLDPAYALILINGEPVIGRTAGTLELSRLNVFDLKQIEIVRGPSSSLYGSEALAGVINLISEEPSLPLKISFQSLYGSYNTLDISSSGQFVSGISNGSLFINSRRSDGYDLTPESESNTAPKYKTYTINPMFGFKFSESTSIKFNGRVFLEEQSNTAVISENGLNTLLDDKNKLSDWNASVSVMNNSFPLKTEIKLYATKYKTENTLVYKENGITYDKSNFDQNLYKGEVFGNYTYNGQNLTSVGFGYITENVKADRIVDGIKKTNSYYSFVQHEWIPSGVFDLVIGARFDSHSDYSSRFSPKLSLLIKPLESLSFRGSVGSGFKAPTMQQLYLDFTNPQVGYSVFGSTNFISSFEKSILEGQIAQILIDPTTVREIRAESSIAFNLGLEYTLIESIFLSANLFRNNVHDLIDAVPVALKNNGQSIYTYLNINKIYTQGIESEITFKPTGGLSISFGYQYLEAVDEDVIEQIKEGKISKPVSSGRIRKVTEADYGGLFNRSNHSGSIRISYLDNDLGLSANLSGIIKGKYGFGDVNGNGILDDYREYVKGYGFWNLNLTKYFFTNLRIQLRVENIFNRTNKQYIPSMPGRIFYAGLRWELINK